MRKPLAAAAISIAFLLPNISAAYSQSAAGAGSSKRAAEQEVQLAANQAAQGPRRSTAASEGETDNVARVNAWTVGVVGGLLEGSFIRFAAELAKALDDGENLRVLPIVSYGATDNVNDLLYLKGVDIAITNSDVFEEFKRNRNIGNIDKRINYISQMYVSEVHIFARSDIKSLKDLDGKPVSLGVKGAGQTVTGPIIFERMGVKPQFIFGNSEAHAEKLKTGEIAAIVHNGGKPNPLFTKLKADPNLHFLSVPYSEKFADYYVPSTFDSKDYPNLLKEGETIETIGIPAVLAVYNWPKSSDRFRKVERFIQYYFNRFENLQKPPFHPKWKDINLAANVPGWTRYSVAEEMLAKAGSGGARNNTEATASISTGGGAGAPRSGRQLSPEEERLFEEFLASRKQKQN
jgi:TRAP-type uncharacterized transport system substrate-binding protein